MEVGFRRRRSLKGRLESLKLEFAIFQGLDKTFDRGNTLCRLGLVCRTKFEGAIGLKLL